MREDPIVKEVRDARLEIERECDNDFRKIYERALEIQKTVRSEKTASTSEDFLAALDELPKSIPPPRKLFSEKSVIDDPK